MKASEGTRGWIRPRGYKLSRLGLPVKTLSGVRIWTLEWYRVNSAIFDLVLEREEAGIHTNIHPWIPDKTVQVWPDMFRGRTQSPLFGRLNRDIVDSSLIGIWLHFCLAVLTPSVPFMPSSNLSSPRDSIPIFYRNLLCSSSLSIPS